MQFPTIAVLLSALTGLVSAQSSSMGMSMSSSSAWMNSTITMTTVVTAFTTYCPSPTLLTYNDVVITVTEATMITVTNCPCTLTSVCTSCNTHNPYPINLPPSIPHPSPLHIRHLLLPSSFTLPLPSLSFLHNY